MIKPTYFNFFHPNARNNLFQDTISFKGNADAPPKQKLLIVPTLGKEGFSKVAGMVSLKIELRNAIISPLTNAVFQQRGIKPLDAIILHGLPRVGKTFIANALAEELHRPVTTIQSTDFSSLYIHESANALSRQFNSILMHENSILLLDEIEAIAPERLLYNHLNTMPDWFEQISVLVNKLIECRKRGILVIGTTNHPELIDKAVKDRFTRTFFVPPPDKITRELLFQNELCKIPFDNDIDVTELAKRTNNYTAEKIASVINEANIYSANKGDATVKMEHLLLALEKIKAPITPDDLEQYRLDVSTTESTGISGKPKTTTFKDVAGMKDVKKELYEDIILPLRNPELYDKLVEEFPNGHLLYGPPGCGKTWISRALAGEVGRTFIEFDSIMAADSDLVRKTFNAAIYNSPSILFLDELEALVPKRDSSTVTAYDNQRTSEFLKQLNDCAREQVYVIGATNHPELIDDAIKRTGRFDRKTFIPPLDKEAREELFIMRLNGYEQIGEGIDFKYLADLTHNFSAAQINKIVRDLKREVYRTIVEGINQNAVVTQHGLVEKIRATKPELTDAVVRRFKNLL